MGLFDKLGDAEHNEQRVVALEGATAVRARIDMAVGELSLVGGATDLLRGQFIYDKELEPELHYDVRAGVGELAVVQSRGRRLRKPGRNRWELAFNDAVPLDLTVNMATGKLDARLASLQLTNVRVSQSTGETVLDLGGYQLALSEVRVEQSTGRIQLDLNGNYAALRKVRINATTGESVVNFAGGAWGQDLEARIDMTTGNSVISLPRETGVEVSTKSTLGKITVSGLSFDGRFYHNEAFGTSGPTLRLDVRTSVGKLALEVAG